MKSLINKLKELLGGGETPRLLPVPVRVRAR